MDICDKCHQPTNAIQAPYRGGGTLQINEPKVSGLKRITSYLWLGLWYNRSGLFRRVSTTGLRAIVGVGMLGVVFGIGWLFFPGLYGLGEFINSITFKKCPENYGDRLILTWFIGLGTVLSLPISWFLGSILTERFFPSLNDPSHRKLNK